MSDPQRRTSMAITALAVLALVVVSAIFIAETESWYLAFKALHVVAALIWIGGGTLLAILALSAERARDPERMLAIVRQAEWAANRIFLPAAFAVLVFGIGMVVNADFDWGEFWILFGLIAWGVSTVLGASFLGPQTKRLRQLISERGASDPETQAVLGRLLLFGRIDLAVLFLIVVDMTVKPFS